MTDRDLIFEKALELKNMPGNANVGKRMLIIDDEEYILGFIKFAIQEYFPGNEVFTIDNSVDAITAIKHLDPHITFIDLKMPGMTGDKLLPFAGPGNKIIIISAYIEDNAWIECQQHKQVKAALKKPIEMQSIINVLSELLPL